jgi:transcriptional regulator with XRE-family HTH domain
MIDVEIGPRLRSARHDRGLTLRTLAADVGVSAALISQVERGRTQPSVTTLYALVDRLGVSLDWLIGLTPAGQPLEEPRNELLPVRRADSHPVLHIANGVRWELVASPADGATEAVLVTYDDGASSSPDGDFTAHDGVESAFVIEGVLVVQLGDEEFEVAAGDSLVFDSRRPHRYVNRSGRTARGIWFSTGASHLS